MSLKNQLRAVFCQVLKEIVIHPNTNKFKNPLLPNIYLIFKHLYKILEVMSQKTSRNILRRINKFQLNHSTDNFRGALILSKEQLINIENINSQLIGLVKHSRQSCIKQYFFISLDECLFGIQRVKQEKFGIYRYQGFSLFDSNLSQLNNVEINSCNLICDDLSNEEWTNVICKEKPLLKGHENEVLEVQFNRWFIHCIYRRKWQEHQIMGCKPISIHQLIQKTLQCGYHKVMIALFSDGILRILNTLLVKFKQKKYYILNSEDNLGQKKQFTTVKALNFQIFTLHINSSMEECIYQILSSRIQIFLLNPTKATVVLLEERNIFLKMYIIEFIDIVKSLQSSQSFEYCQSQLTVKGILNQVQYLVIMGDILAFYLKIKQYF
ncbi:unnamed protein product [Paramecium primaurelia]|uniref:Uncharacterized protein n=1 Tax=Paramecium primaurelia TaxID=5886 RepID=A0A8S1QFN5_PARPR|nr:unnamed protein product [Paramecium primaurelia]